MGSNRQNCGRKRSTSERDDRQLARLAKKNRFCSSKRLAGMWKETGVVEWRHLTEQHMEGCMNRVSAAVYTSCKTFAQWQTTTEAAEVVQREERRKKKDDRAMVFSHVFRRGPSLLFLLETKVPECGGKRVNRTWTEHRWLPQAKCEVSTISYGLGGDVISWC